MAFTGHSTNKVLAGRHGAFLVGDAVSIAGMGLATVSLKTVAVATATVEVSGDGTNYVAVGSCTVGEGSKVIQLPMPTNFVQVTVAAGGTVAQCYLCALPDA